MTAGRRRAPNEKPDLYAMGFTAGLVEALMVCAESESTAQVRQGLLRLVADGQRSEWEARRAR